MTCSSCGSSTGWADQRHDAFLLCIVGTVVDAALCRRAGRRAEPDLWLTIVPMMAGSLVLVAPCGLPLALGCRRLWRRKRVWTLVRGISCATERDIDGDGGSWGG